MAAAVTMALALCALLAGASAHGRTNDKCTKVTVGSENGKAVELKPVDLPAFVPNTKVDIPADQACYPYRPVGYQLIACDPDGPPPPRVFPLLPFPPYEAIIERHPPAYSTGELYVTVYCSGSYGYAPPARGAWGAREASGAGGEGGVGGGQVEVRELVAGGGGGGGGRGRGGVAVVPYV